MQQRRSVEVFNMGDFASLPPPSSLTGFISSQRSYGATRLNLEMADTKFISHVVEPNDTLQSISVKYGVSVERLKRVNKIWSNESLFLLKTLKIPFMKPASKWEDESDSEDEVLYKKDKGKQMEAGTQEKQITALEKQTGNGEEKEEKKEGKEDENIGAEKFDNCNDFFSMIDNRINKCKEEWTKIRSNSQGSSGVPTVSYESSDTNKVLSPTKHYKHFGERI